MPEPAAAISTVARPVSRADPGRSLRVRALLTCRVFGVELKPVVQALDWAIASGAKVIILPFGHTGPPRGIGPCLAEAIRRGVLVFAAAGNRGPDRVLYPVSSS